MDDRDDVVPSATEAASALPNLRWPALDWMMIACACLALALYANTLQHGWALDDYPTIYGNRLTMSGLRGIPTMLHTGYWYGLDGMNDWLYRPLSLVMFAVEWQVSRGSPAMGHYVNVALYALTACALYRFLRELFDTYHVAVPLAITVLWIAHPLHTEVVANIKNRENRRIQVQIQCEFKDAQGFATDSPPWENLILTENSTDTKSFVSLNDKAKRYTVRVRQAR